MRLTLEPTTEFFLTDDGFPVRAWRGTTGRGVAVIAFISAVCADEANADAAAVDELRRELHALPGPLTPMHHVVAEREVRPEMNEPGCKERGGPVNVFGACLVCDAEAGERCRLSEVRP